MKSTKKKGFTLVELLVVITVIGILVTAVTSSLIDAREKARIARFKLEIRDFMMALEFYHIDNGYYPNRENGLTHQNSDMYYLKALTYNPGPDANWDELTTKMSPYYDLTRLVDSIEKLKKKAYYIRYTPREYCGTGNASGALGQEYSILFLLRRTYDRIPEYYVRSGGNYHFHCIHHDSRGNYQI